MPGNIIWLLFGIIIYANSCFGQKQHFIYVSKIGWHTGVIVPAYVFPEDVWPDTIDYSGYDYLEIGWGDRDYFQHATFNFWYALKAVFWPTPTALHILPIMERHIPVTYTGKKLVKLKISDMEFKCLSEFLHAQFDFTEKGSLIPLGEGFYYNSHFFMGRTKYYFPKNSNVWAAMALKRAGLKYAPIIYQTSGMVVNRADNFGEIIRPEHEK